MNDLTLRTIRPADAHWPVHLSQRLGAAAPPSIDARGPVNLLSTSKTALFCSAHSPGDAILRAHDAARRMRDEGVTVISGFHSPIEKECLQILLRGKQPIIVCPARDMHAMRIPIEYRPAFDAARVLFLSPFAGLVRRVTKESAAQRNEFVAALADNAFIPHVSLNGETERIVEMLTAWKVSILRLAR